MSEKLLDILKPKGDCIAESRLYDYAAGKLSQENARAVEEHLSECSLCSDALDGIMSKFSAQDFRSGVDEVRRIVKHRAGAAERNSTFPVTRMLAIAATLMLLAISAWYVQYMINNSSEKIFTTQFEPYPSPPVQTVISPTQNPVAEDETEAKKNDNKNSTEKNNSEQKAIKDEPETTAASSDKDAVAEAVPPAEKSSDNNPFASGQKADSVSVAVMESEPDISSSATMHAPSTASEVLSSKTLRSSASSENSTNDQFISQHLDAALGYYHNNRYAEAIAEFQLVLQKNPNHAEANFFAGVSSLALENADEALRYLKKTDNKNNQYYEASLWYEALAHVKKDEKNDARKLLQKVTELSGAYKAKAEDLLHQLE